MGVLVVTVNVTVWFIFQLHYLFKSVTLQAAAFVQPPRSLFVLEFWTDSTESFSDWLRIWFSKSLRLSSENICCQISGGCVLFRSLMDKHQRSNVWVQWRRQLRNSLCLERFIKIKRHDQKQVFCFTLLYFMLCWHFPFWMSLNVNLANILSQVY